MMAKTNRPSKRIDYKFVVRSQIVGRSESGSVRPSLKDTV